MSKVSYVIDEFGFLPNKFVKPPPYTETGPKTEQVPLAYSKIKFKRCEQWSNKNTTPTTPDQLENKGLHGTIVTL